MFAKIIALGAVVVSLLDESADLFALTPDHFYAAGDLVLLCGESLLELHFIAFTVAESP